jgi:hypothetical protein
MNLTKCGFEIVGRAPQAENLSYETLVRDKEAVLDAIEHCVRPQEIRMLQLGSRVSFAGMHYVKDDCVSWFAEEGHIDWIIKFLPDKTAEILGPSGDVAYSGTCKVVGRKIEVKWKSVTSWI